MCMEVDLNSHTAKRLPLKTSTLTSVIVGVHNGAMVVVGSHFNPLEIFRDFSKVKEIRIMSRYRTCKNGEQISERWSQQRGDDIFTIDDDNNRLYRLRWSDILNGKYLVELFANQAEDFYAARNNKMSVLYMNGLLMIDDGKKIELKTVKKKAKWTIVIRSLSRWIVSGDVDGYAVLASINDKAELESTIEIKLTALANGLYQERQKLIPTMYAIKVVFHRRNRPVLLVVERDGCFHLVAQASKRPLLLLKSYGRVSFRCEDHPYDRIISTATKMMIEG